MMMLDVLNGLPDCVHIIFILSWAVEAIGLICAIDCANSRMHLEDLYTELDTTATDFMIATVAVPGVIVLSLVFLGFSFCNRVRVCFRFWFFVYCSGSVFLVVQLGIYVVVKSTDAYCEPFKIAAETRAFESFKENVTDLVVLRGRWEHALLTPEQSKVGLGQMVMNECQKDRGGFIGTMVVLVVQPIVMLALCIMAMVRFCGVSRGAVVSNSVSSGDSDSDIMIIGRNRSHAVRDNDTASLAEFDTTEQRMAEEFLSEPRLLDDDLSDDEDLERLWG